MPRGVRAFLNLSFASNAFIWDNFLLGSASPFQYGVIYFYCVKTLVFRDNWQFLYTICLGSSVGRAPGSEQELSGLVVMGSIPISGMLVFPLRTFCLFGRQEGYAPKLPDGISAILVFWDKWRVAGACGL